MNLRNTLYNFPRWLTIYFATYFGFKHLIVVDRFQKIENSFKKYFYDLPNIWGRLVMGVGYVGWFSMNLFLLVLKY